MKILKKSVWCMLTIFFSILFLIFFIGSNVAVGYDSYINEFFNTRNYEIIKSEEGEIFNEYPSDYVNADGSLNHKAMRENSLRVATQTATEGTVLFWNDNEALPLEKDSKISFFGVSSSKYLFSGAGSGHLGVSVTTNLTESCRDNGLIVNPSLSNAYRILSSKYGNYLTELGKTIAGNSSGDNCYVEYGINEAPWSQIDKTTVGNVSSTFKEYGDAALFIISRNDGEDGDTNYQTPECLDGNYMDLAYEEVTILDNLMKLKKDGVFKKVILLINAANAMQMKNIQKYDLDACVWLGIGGNVSFDQIAQVISGKANPSGHLIDTYLYDNYSAPSTVNQGNFTFKTTDGLPSNEQYSKNDHYVMYSEGIYVGYRYFETRYEDTVLNQGSAEGNKGIVNGSDKWDYSQEVAYPFGYGLGYTTFSKSGYKVVETNSGYQIKVNVTNTGKVAGKDVVQVYLQKPYTEYDKQKNIEKSAIELVGYQKTKLLEPNETQEISIFVEKELLKSYDTYGYGTYIVEPGDYYLATGDNSHDALNNILAQKGKKVADGMDKEGDESFSYKFTIKELDAETYSYSQTTHNKITNQFSEADPLLYEGLKDQFTNFKYLSRSNWNDTYPTPVVMDCTSPIMIKDMQYRDEVVNDENAKMPTFGKSGNKSLMQMWGLEYNDPQWEELLNQITWEEAVTLVTYGGGTGGCVSVNAPDSLAKDGPGGIGQGNPALPNIMCFPCECLMAATFNDELIEKLGNAFGMEILHVGYTGIYGPGANIHRSAFSGRNWEYYSEDPFISGKMLSSEVKGLQNRGVIVFTKHFLLNDQERNRYGVTVWSNEQAIREIYLTAFEDGITEGKMNGIMSSFNRIGTKWAGKHKGLLTEVLRNEWGFVGVVQTDAYVGTHMHQALAESVVAGNDFTMGGSNPTALDAYRNNATVASAVRETCHRILYTKLHSNSMNGFTVNSKVVPATPWWKTALNVGTYTSLSVAVICLCIFILSFIIPMLVNKKLKLEESNKGRKIKYFFDVISKQATIISGTCMALIIATSISVPLIVKNANKPIVHTCESVCEVCGGCLNESCQEEACLNKCTCNLPCEHACSICGLCLDYESTEEKCLEKCGSKYSNTQTFEAEDSHVYLYGGERGGLGIAKETDKGATEEYIGGYNANLGANIKYVIHSDIDTRATLFASVCKRNAPQLFTNNILVIVNGKIIESKGVVPATKEGDNEWTTFVDVCLGCIDLKSGRNYLSFIVANDDVSCGFNFNNIKIKSDTTLTWYEGAHVCDDICPTCGLCTNDQCTDPACVEKCDCNVEKQTFAIADKKALLEGVVDHNTYVEFNGENQKVTYKIKSLNKNNGILFANLKNNSTINNISDLLTIRVNDKEIDVTSSLESKNDFTLVKLGRINLVYGENVIEFISKTNNSLFLQDLVLGVNDELTYKNPNEFLVTSDYVLVEGEAYKSEEYCISMIENAQGSIVTFPIDSDRDTTADLYLNLASRSTPATIEETLKISVNGIKVNTEAVVPNEGREYFTYSDVLINNVHLVKGSNEITIEVLTNDVSKNTNLRYILFDKTSANLSWSNSASANRTIIEAEDATIVPFVYEGRSYPSVAGGQQARGDLYLGGVNDAGLYGPGQSSIKFTITSEFATKAKFYFGAGVSGSARAASYTVKIGSTEYNSSQVWSGDGWYDWKDQYFGRIDLQQGVNNLEIIIKSNETINIDYFILETASTISLVK